MLRKDCVDELCDAVYGQTCSIAGVEYDFSDLVKVLSDYYDRDEKIVVLPNVKCSSCEFKVIENENPAHLLSGFKACWQEAFGWKDEDFDQSSVLDLWNYRYKQRLIDERKLKAADVQFSDINPAPDGKPGLSKTERQWLQVEMARKSETSCWLDRENLMQEMSGWIFPLHMIDFETAKIAIPFNRGRHPYEDIAFQFSHHVIHQDGTIKHAGQYIETRPGYFPNFDFIRALMKELGNHDGSIFRYAAHENTILRAIRRQIIQNKEEVDDYESLCGFIDSITEYKEEGRKSQKIQGTRNMIDLLELVKRFYYDPCMKGSNSIKKVLPAILNGSGYLRDKYSQPVYGSENGIPSLNYVDKAWITLSEGHVVDPYRSLRTLFRDIPDFDLTLLSEEDETINEGGAAAMAYARMQATDMAENLFAQEMLAYGYDDLHFWTSGNTAEVDFVLDNGNRIIPVDVKSADNVRAKSLNVYSCKYDPEIMVRTSMREYAYSKDQKLLSLPLYLLFNFRALTL